MSFQAKDIMTPNPVCVEIGSPVRDAVDELLNADFRHIPVVEAGRLVGMLSDRDLRSNALPPQLQAADPRGAGKRLEVPVDEIMETDLVTAAPETDLNELIDIIISEGVGAVPVADPENRQLLGVVSYVDVLRAVREL